MEKRVVMNLQLFADGGEGGSGGSGGQGGNAGSGNGGQGSAGATYSYEQAEEIANARASKAERSALANYFRSQGMTEDEVTAAINDFKTKKQANQPNVSQLTQERDDALKKVTQYENEKLLTSKGVRAEDLDYVAFKVAKMVTDKKDFKTAAEEYLKANPRFTENGQSYRVSTGVSSGGSSGGTETKNEHINNMIRNAFGR